MRLDKFLWWSRLCRTRSEAQALAQEGRLRINGRPVDRAHAAVAEGQVLSFALHGKVRALRIAALPSRRGPPAEGRACYEDLLVGDPDAGSAPVDDGAYAP